MKKKEVKEIEVEKCYVCKNYIPLNYRLPTGTLAFLTTLGECKIAGETKLYNEIPENCPLRKHDVLVRLK